MIEIKDITKNFGTKCAVDIDRFTIRDGELLGLVGNNGAGKTTLFRILLGLLRPDSGEVHIDGIDISASEEWKDFTSAYIDDGFLIDYLTPEEYFYFIGKIIGLDKETVNERLTSFDRFMNNEIIDQKKYIRNFSVGNKQKIGIIGALLSLPKIVILDEPFNFIDPTSQSLLMQLLRKYQKEHQATIVISSHNLDQTVHICNRIVLMENGKILRDIVNENGSALDELKRYFNIDEADFDEKIKEEQQEETATAASPDASSEENENKEEQSISNQL